MVEYLIEMSRESKLLTLFLIVALLVLSYNYVIGEAQDAADDDPTHTGKAWLALLMPYLWLMFIILALVVAVLETFDALS